jgi:uncharacterized protein YdaU (DUF1376 family)
MAFYVGDYLADTGHLGPAEHGAYLLLIFHYWQHDGLPKDDRQLARIVRMTPEEWAETRPSIASFFDAKWRHKRIDEELKSAQEKYAKRAAAGAKGGKQKGNSQAMLKPGLSKLPSKSEARLNQPQPHLKKEKERNLGGKKEEGEERLIEVQPYDPRWAALRKRWSDEHGQRAPPSGSWWFRESWVRDLGAQS